MATLNFIQSLSDCPPSRCHPKALGYKIEFEARKNELVHYLFKLYNERVFENMLSGHVEIDWSTRMKSSPGYCFNNWIRNKKGRIRTSTIDLSDKVCNSPDKVRDVLIHELCHAASWIVSGVRDGHGEDWLGWRLKAMRRMRGLPEINLCDLNKVKRRYTYKCKTCDYTLGRSKTYQYTGCSRCWRGLELDATSIGSPDIDTDSDLLDSD